ncbi:hypothetical protein DIURU_003281 [Diutina rugosa]|uniref:DNA replication complex GINS protein PSF1 n=1 Tax=Diutina rugosa TaxID=5481 RepID=A0A642ULL8_DIURU|nr:uncharacterized protein DIURU_003281 [Diutina rugosa]KAA8901336.1 hypothetical protein DIURU_003281 [Diutina rugosa]
MYGDLGYKLVLDAKRGQANPGLSIYQSDLVNDIVQEINDLHRDMSFLEQTSDDSKVAQCQTFVTQLCMRRNKRCLLGYQRARASRIDEVVWGGNTGSSRSVENLSHAEQEYFRQYQNLVMDYNASFPDLDLAGSLEPPTGIFIDVRVLKDGGEVQTEYGSFNLIKDSQFYVRRNDVERLIQQGYLEEI